MINKEVIIDSPLPIIQGIHDSVYRLTPTPQSIEECNILIRDLQSAVTDIGLQINSKNIDANFEEWKRTAYAAMRLKKSQIAILKRWKYEFNKQNYEFSQNEYVKRLQDELNVLNEAKRKNNEKNVNELQDDFQNDPGLARKLIKEVKKVTKEIKFLRGCLGDIYDVILKEECITNVDVQERLKVLADALNNRD